MSETAIYGGQWVVLSYCVENSEFRYFPGDLWAYPLCGPELITWPLWVHLRRASQKRYFTTLRNFLPSHLVIALVVFLKIAIDFAEKARREIFKGTYLPCGILCNFTENRFLYLPLPYIVGKELFYHIVLKNPIFDTSPAIYGPTPCADRS